MSERTALAADAEPVGRPSRGWRYVAAVEVALCVVAVVADLAIPTLVILLIAGVSLAYRRRRPASLGFHRLARPRVAVPQILGLAVVWTIVQVALVMPLVERATGERQDMTSFDGLEGNLGMLVVLLVLSWTLAAIGEETAYRGFVLTRTREVIGGSLVGVVIAVGLSSVLFGLAHTEQGMVGVALTTIDAVFFSVLRLRYRSVWAAVLAHGFNNTIGLTAFYLVGPVYGLW